MSEKDAMKLSIRVSIEPAQYGMNVSGNLNLQEDFIIPTLGFLEMCQILGQFKALADKFKAQK
jgi:hypothetical protein